MGKAKLEVQNYHGALVGYVHLSTMTRLPAFIKIDGELYQRYGQVSAYYYRHEPDVYEPHEREVTKE